MSCGGSSALRWTGAWKSVQSVWVCAAGRADGWYFDWKLCYRAGADRVRTGDGYREEKRSGISEGNGENRNGISEGGGEKRQRAGRKGRRKSKRWNLARSAGKSEGVRQDHDGGGNSGGCIKNIGNRKFISGSRSASAGATATRPAITASAGATTTRPAVTASAGTTTARPAVTASAETTATGAISSTSGNTL